MKATETIVDANTTVIEGVPCGVEGFGGLR